MESKVLNKNKNCVFNGPYAGRDLYITMFQDNEREFVVTHNADIRPVSYFTGRETELKDLRQRIEEGRKSVLVSGMGGIGKTHICRKLFEEYLNGHAEGGHEPFRYIGYIEYAGNMSSSLQNCLKFKQQDNPEQNQEAAWRELEYLAADGKLLLFVDNVNVPIGEDAGLGRLKQIPGAVVLTSRRTSFSKEFESYRIGFLSTEQCVEIYERIRYEDSGKKVQKEEIPDLEYIIDEMAAGHTITVEFLAHLAYTKSWSAKRLREELTSNGFCLQYKDEEDKLINIQEAYETLYDLSGLTAAEQNVLEAFSVFPYIPLAAEICNQWLLADAGVSEEDDILMGLYQKGWLQFDIVQESYSMHPVFAQFIFEECRFRMKEHLGLIASCQKSLEVSKNGSIQECQRYTPFAENFLKKFDRIKSSKITLIYCNSLKVIPFMNVLFDKLYFNRCKKWIDFMFAFINQLVRVAEYEKSEKWCRIALKICENELRGNYLITAQGYNNLAMVYECKGKYKEAEELFKKVILMREKVLGKEHLGTANSYNNLAVVYMSIGRYKEAEELFKKVLFIREKVLGEDYLELATGYCYNNLGVVYDIQGRYKEAEELYKKAILIREKVLGKEHLDTVNGYNNLAMVYKSQGRYKEAEELYKRVLLKCEEVLGEEHPYTVTSYSNLAAMYESQGRYKEAEGLFKKAMLIREKVLGKEHIDTANSYSNLAAEYMRQGRYKISLIYYTKAHKIFVSTLGVKHPSTQRSYASLKITYLEWNPEGNFEQWLEEKMKESD